ncbi:hypothetical protein [Lysobacter terrae]
MVAKVVSCRAGVALAFAALLGLQAHAAEPAKPKLSTSAAKESAADDYASEAKTRQMREASIAIQQRLRAEQRKREQAQREQTRNERCVGGQRMRRVANGWVGVGNC